MDDWITEAASLPPISLQDIFPSDEVPFANSEFTPDANGYTLKSPNQTTNGYTLKSPNNLELLSETSYFNATGDVKAPTNDSFLSNAENLFFHEDFGLARYLGMDDSQIAFLPHKDFPATSPSACSSTVEKILGDEDIDFSYAEPSDTGKAPNELATPQQSDSLPTRKLSLDSSQSSGMVEVNSLILCTGNSNFQDLPIPNLPQALSIDPGTPKKASELHDDSKTKLTGIKNTDKLIKRRQKNNKASKDLRMRKKKQAEELSAQQVVKEAEQKQLREEVSRLQGKIEELCSSNARQLENMISSNPKRNLPDFFDKWINVIRQQKLAVDNEDAFAKSTIQKVLNVYGTVADKMFDPNLREGIQQWILNRLEGSKSR